MIWYDLCRILAWEKCSICRLLPVSWFAFGIVATKRGWNSRQGGTASLLLISKYSSRDYCLDERRTSHKMTGVLNVEIPMAAWTVTGIGREACERKVKKSENPSFKEFPRPLWISLGGFLHNKRVLIEGEKGKSNATTKQIDRPAIKSIWQIVLRMRYTMAGQFMRYAYIRAWSRFTTLGICEQT